MKPNAIEDDMKMMFSAYGSNITQYRKQRGVVLFVTLLALVIMMITGVTLIRSTDTNLLVAGNMAFKRDLTNQAERAIPKIQALFKTGALRMSSSRQTNSVANNYYATVLPSNNSGIPFQLGTIANAGTNKIYDDTSGVTIYYVIDRMCLSAGEVSDTYCTLASNNSTGSGERGQTYNFQPIYRMTLKITGPRNTEAYLQTTYADS